MFLVNIYILFVSFLVISGSKVMENDDFNEKAGEIDPQLVNYVRDQTELNWPLGIVPFYIDKESYDDIISRRIRHAMNSIESVSCIVFKQIDDLSAHNYSTWLYFSNQNKERECVHQTSLFANGEVIVVLGFNCMQRRDILHTLLHALGFRDEVTHPQRDLYVRIFWENIQPKYRSLFNIQLDGTTQKTIVEYDPMSVMHFHDRAFSSNGGATIGPLVPGLIISPSENLSQLDQMRLRLLFGHECNKRKVGDLLDTCKMVLHGQNDNEETRPDEGTDVEEHQEPESGSQHNENGEDDLGQVENLPSENDEENDGSN